MVIKYQGLVNLFHMGQGSFFIPGFIRIKSRELKNCSKQAKQMGNFSVLFTFEILGKITRKSEVSVQSKACSQSLRWTV